MKSMKTREKVMIVIAISFAAFILGWARLNFIENKKKFDEFLELRSASTIRIRLPVAAISFDIKDRKTIETFFRAIEEAPEISPHHSHPVNALLISFDADPRIYSLGHDSSNLDEYWFSVGKNASPTLKQFSSVALSQWLKENDLWYPTERVKVTRRPAKPPTWVVIGVLGFALALIVLLILKRKGILGPRGLLIGAAGVVMVPYLAMPLIFRVAEQRMSETVATRLKAFEGLEDRVSRIFIFFGEKTIEISNPIKAKTFIGLIKNGQQIGDHPLGAAHSIVIGFPEAEERYQLTHDMENLDEYQISIWDSLDRTEVDNYGFKRFKSPGLSNWLKKENLFFPQRPHLP